MNLVRGIDFNKLAEKMGGCNGAEVKVFVEFISDLFYRPFVLKQVCTL